MAIDITGPKVLTPAILFALLSPGLILSLPSLRLFPGVKTDFKATLLHAIVLALVYYIIACCILRISLRPADLVVPVVLFILLTPGILLTIPPGRKGVFMSGQSSLSAIGVHTIVFALLFSFLRGKFPNVY
jgi:hypothetical protein